MCGGVTWCVVFSPCRLSGEVVCFVEVCDLLLSGAVRAVWPIELRLGSPRNFASVTLACLQPPHLLLMTFHNTDEHNIIDFLTIQTAVYVIAGLSFHENLSNTNSARSRRTIQ
jgi:hypothetical protein